MHKLRATINFSAAPTNTLIFHRVHSRKCQIKLTCSFMNKQTKYVNKRCYCDANVHTHGFREY